MDRHHRKRRATRGRVEQRLPDLVSRFRRRGLTKRHRAPIKERAPLATELEAVSTRLERVLDLYSRGKLDETTLEQVSRRLRRRQDAIREQLATLEAPLEVDFTVNQERLRTFLADMERWIREGDVVRRTTLLREVYRELRIWPKTATKPWTRKVFVAANLDALTRFWMVSRRDTPLAHFSHACISSSMPMRPFGSDLAADGA